MPPTLPPRIVVKAKDAGLPLQRSVCVLNTGGTISMRANAEGALEPSPGYLARRMLEMPELRRPETPAVTLFELLPLVDSSDMGCEDWLRLAAIIEELYDDFDAFVVIMGTDTMAYCASALSFLLEDLAKMVVLTGSMLPLSDLFNDAQRNLVVSLVMAATLDVPEVCIFMVRPLSGGAGGGAGWPASRPAGLQADEQSSSAAGSRIESGRWRLLIDRVVLIRRANRRPFAASPALASLLADPPQDDQLLRGNRTVKSNSSGLDAFESPNYPALAKLETGIRLRRGAVLAQPKGRFRVHRELDTNVAVWRMVS